MAPLGRALEEHHFRGVRDAALVVHVEGAPPERLSASYFFREPSAMGAVERTALALARGRVLDVGACAGAHAVPLVRRGLLLTALEPIPAALRILRDRGVSDARAESVWTFRAPAPYDTVLALMNGTSLAGTAGRLGRLLARLRELVGADGQLLIDSTALVTALDQPPEGDGGEGGADGEGEPATAGPAAAVELHYQLEYRGEKGPPFPQLFVDEHALARAGSAAGWSAKVVAREGERYLARLSPAG